MAGKGGPQRLFFWAHVGVGAPFAHARSPLSPFSQQSTSSWSAPPAAAAAVSPQQQQQQQQQQRERQRQRLSPLAALMADDYLFADADADGRVSPTELASAAAQMGREAGLPALPDTAPDFAARLYDLDGDGELTTDEMLRAMALDAAVDNEAGRLDGGILRAFDADGSGGVSRAEWVGALGPVQGGEAVAGAVFARADLLTGARGQLAPEGLAAALTAARALLLGW